MLARTKNVGHFVLEHKLLISGAVTTAIGVILASVSAAVPAGLPDDFTATHPDGGNVTRAEVCVLTNRGLLTVDYRVDGAVYTVRDAVTPPLSASDAGTFVKAHAAGQKWRPLRYNPHVPARATLVPPDRSPTPPVLLTLGLLLVVLGIALTVLSQLGSR